MGSQSIGEGRIFLKTHRDASFNKIYRMSLISTGSISLDSTFNNNIQGLARNTVICFVIYKSNI
jgi:hypothetical protein